MSTTYPTDNKKKLTSFFGNGKLVDTLNFTADDLTIGEIARGLARINRYSGNGVGFEYVSVAQHSVNLSYLVPKGLEKAALLHDMPELFIGDVPSPIKMLCPVIQEIDEAILRNIGKIYGIKYQDFIDIHPFDKALARDEGRMLFPEVKGDFFLPEGGLGLEIQTMDTKRAAAEFERRFWELYMGEQFYA